MIKNRFLHVYGQSSDRNPVTIVGTRAALENLQRAINSVISSGRSENSHTARFACADEQEFELEIVLTPKENFSASMEKNVQATKENKPFFYLPYHDFYYVK